MLGFDLNSMQETMVSVHNLSKTYAGKKAVERLSFEIRRSEFFGLLGPNGAGKTTTIGMLTGLINPSEGNITIDALDVPTNALAVKAKIGFVPQDFAFYPTLSAKDNLLFFGRIYGLRGRQLKRRIDNVLQSVELLDKAGGTVSTFSNGMKRRLNIAIGMLHSPQLLILDEPTVGVDTHVKQVILENLQTLNQAGLTVLLTTHHMEEAQRLCHRVAIMDKGTIVALDAPSALIADMGKGMVRVCFSKSIPAPLKGEMEKLGKVVLMDPGIAHILIGEVSAEKIIRFVRSAAAAANASIKRLSILEPSLETVFLHLTGRAAGSG